MVGFDLDALMRGVERAQIRRLQFCQLVPPLIIADLRPLFEGVRMVKTRVIELLLYGRFHEACVTVALKVMRGDSRG